MKTKKTIILCMFTFATIGLSLDACKKDNSSTSTTSPSAGVDASVSATASETMYDDAFGIVAQGSDQTGISSSSIAGTPVVDGLSTSSGTFATSGGATITLLPADPSVFPKTMTIDFGAGIKSADSVTRKGQIIVTLSGKLRVAGSVITVTFNNYSVNGYALTGTYSLTPKIASNSGINYSITVVNGSITFPNGSVSNYSGTEIFTQTGGMSTPSVADDTYAITGNFSYSSTATGSISGTITTALVKSADCKDITSGIIAFNYKGLNGTLDFGSGACDNLATITFGKTVKVITLAK